MKKYLLLFVLGFTAFTIQAQNLTIDDVEIEVVEADATVNPIKGKTYVHNNTSTTNVYVWNRTNVVKPDEWEISVCDNNLCYFSTVNSQPFELTPGQEGLISIQLKANGVDGVGEVYVSVENEANAEEKVEVTFHFIVGSTSTDDLAVRTIQTYPNPANDVFNIIDSANDLGVVTIYNIIGRPIHSYAATTSGQYDVSNLATGLYLVQLKDANGAIVKTIRMHKN